MHGLPTTTEAAHMRTHIHAIPTSYAGINFRSRLEARWAVFFTALGWEWDYEAVDARGWIPDFIVRIPEQQPMAIECKPACTIEELTDHQNKIARGGFNGRVLLAGSVHFARPNGALCIGKLLNADGDWSDGHLWKPDEARGLPPHWLITRDAMPMGGRAFMSLKMSWGEAQNVTQWKPVA